MIPKTTNRLTLILLAVILSLGQFGNTADAAETWPQWRGPNRDGFATGPTWPGSLAEGRLKPLWHVELGPGYPGPIVAADRVFVAETKDKESEVVRALDRQSGRELWNASWPGSMTVPFMAKSNGDWIRSTPAYDGDSLYIAGMRDVLVCLDAETGKQRWRVDLVEQFKTSLSSFGFVCSPLVIDEHVYVQAAAGFCKLDRRTGKVIWRVLKDNGGMFGGAFSSPIYRRICGQDQIIVQSRQILAGIDPESGNTIWSEKIPAMLGMNILTPTVLQDSIFTSSYGGGSRLLRIQQSDNNFETKAVWETPLQGYMSTPIIIDGHAYLHLRSKRFTCVELATGKQKWTTKPYGKYWSLVAQKDCILALDQRGELFLIRATPEKFDLLDSRKISNQETWGHLAVSGDQIFVRELMGITAYSWR